MARAKQTARADARRRSRIASRPPEADPALAGEVIEGESTAVDAATDDGRAKASSRGRTDIPRRPGFGSLFGSFNQAYRRPNVREDIAALPSLLIGKGFLAAIAMVVVGFIGIEIWPGYSGSSFAFQFLTFPPALAPIFVAGFFSTRASYLLGLLVGLVDAAVYTVWLIGALPTLGAGTGPTDIGLYVGTAFFWSALTGVVFGAGAAWYRRFLQLTSPRRQAQARGQGKGQTRNQPSRGKAATATANSGRRRY
ncbi:MAG TPA: hypothetical protein VF484_00725 [Candidatus Limnocylindrales bacterium]